MKNLLLICFTFFAIQASSQIVLFEDFQDTEAWDLDNVIIDPDDTDTEWVSYDEDGIPPNDPSDPGNWYQGFDLGYANYDIGGPDPDPDSNLVMVSISWLQGFDPGNVNYLITPPIEVNNADYTLTWSSAPFQGPRYMDGYTVRVNTSGDNLAEDFDTILFEAAEMTAIGDSASSNSPDSNLDIANYTFSDGYIHADGYTLTDYYTLDLDDDAYGGILEPHTISLADYVGQTIYLAFVHDSADDNIIMLDDVLIEGTVGVNDYPLTNMVSFYPNPVTDNLNMNFTNMITDGSIFEVYDVNGKKVLERVIYPESNPSVSVNWSGLNTGLYQVRFIVDGVPTNTEGILKM